MDEEPDQNEENQNLATAPKAIDIVEFPLTPRNSPEGYPRKFDFN